MPQLSEPAQSDPLHARQVAVWSAFALLLGLGVILWIRFGGRLTPMLDALLDK